MTDDGTPSGGSSTSQDNESWVWRLGSLLGLVLLVYHLLALWYRWLRPDPDFLGFTASVAELLAIGSFIGFQTERGRDLAEDIGDALPARALWGTPRRACISACIAAMITGLALYVGSPAAASAYRQRGAQALEDGAYSDAVRFFQQAISLDPAEARTHYNLATTYERLYDEEQAIEEYQLALELEVDFWPSYNNLGRLLIEVRERSDAALGVLLAGMRQADSPLGEAVIGKNIAWAYVETGYPYTALDILEEAGATLQTLWADGEAVAIYLADVSRLEARIYEDLDNEEEALRAWQDTLGYALTVAESSVCRQTGIQPPPDCLDAQRWAAEANEVLAASEGDLP